jgi:hypothetical protein
VTTTSVPDRYTTLPDGQTLADTVTSERPSSYRFATPKKKDKESSWRDASKARLR